MPGRVPLKYSVRPALEISGVRSSDTVFTRRPRLTGGPNDLAVDERIETQRSVPPTVPARSEVKKSARPSAEMLGSPSNPELFTDVSAAGAPNGWSIELRLE